MPTSDTSEKGLESIIVSALTGLSVEEVEDKTVMRESVAPYGGAGYVLGSASDFNRDYALDVPKLLSFLQATQPNDFKQLELGEDGQKRRKFLARLQGEITKRGVIDVLRKGVDDYPARLTLFYGTPSAGNKRAQELFDDNIFSVTRQLRYSKDETRLALDLCLFINGLPIITFELKNRLTIQTVDDAVRQYQRDRDPRELIFQFKRCMVHFAVDDQEVRMCTQLKGKESWFLPFNKGWNDGAGNPPNPEGIKTDYLWREILTREGLADILENYAQVVEKKDEKTGKKKYEQIFPRYHQLDVVRKLLADVPERGVGGRYLIQHSAGSGKSNSIAWLSHQLIDIKKSEKPLFDSIIVVTDRRILDQQIKDTIKQFAQVSATIGHADRSGDLRKYLDSGKKIIITTVQKFPFVIDDIGREHRKRKFAIIIDEAHSSQGGRTSAKMHMVLSEHGGEEDDETIEDTINRIIESRRILSNASYFAFTATPKNKTLEIFGEPYQEGEQTKHRPFHSYTMKQAIQEGFILDVLASYTPVESYYRLMKKVEDDPLFDSKRAQKKLRRFVETHHYAIEQKAGIMVDHFHENVLARQKIGGQARAMVVTSGIRVAIDYFFAIRDLLKERRSPYQAIVAFSGEHEYKGQKVTEASLNGFSSNLIADRIQEDPYRLLVVADKFQTGYDEPLLHTMYVDKVLSGIKAVQTLSRLNRAHPKKHDTFVLDFENDSDTIESAFSDYYRTTILSAETDPNKLNDLKSTLDGYHIYNGHVSQLAELYLSGADRSQLDPILDSCVAPYTQDLDEDGQVEFKGKAKSFVRTYNFLATILPYPNPEWEKLSIFLNFLIPKLPAPKEEDYALGILETVDIESYRAEVKASMKIALADEDAEIEPVPIGEGGHKSEPEMDKLSNIIKTFNDLFGNIPWKDKEQIERFLAYDIPKRVAADKAYQNARQNSDEQNARIEHDRALQRVVVDSVYDQTEFYKQFSSNESFRRWVTDTIFWLTYEAQATYDASPKNFPVVQAETFIKQQFGVDPKWAKINEAIWEYFVDEHGKRLGLSAINQIAVRLEVSVDNILSVVSLLTGPNQDYLRRVYYRQPEPERTELVPNDEVIRQTRRWYHEKTIEESEWRQWAGEVLVGWEPVSKETLQ